MIYRAGGRQRKEFARTLDEARRIKRERETDRDRGELQERTTITLRVYLEEWIKRYQGQGRQASERTRATSIAAGSWRETPTASFLRSCGSSI